MNRILIIDDNPAIHSDFRKILAPTQADSTDFDAAALLILGEEAALDSSFPALTFEVDCAAQGQQALTMVQQALREGRPYCVAFVDIRMPPGWDGVETLTHLWKADPELQAVLCSAYSDYTWSDITRRLARPEHILMLKKPFDAIEALQMATLLTEKWLAHRRETAHRAALDQLLAQRTAEATSATAASAESEQRFTMAFQSAPTAQAIMDGVNLQWTTINKAFRALIGCDSATPPTAGTLFANHPTLCAELLDQSKDVRQVHVHIPTPGGQREVLVSRASFSYPGHPHLLVTLEDITSLVETQHQLRQGQKMEAVGQLAAGLAHDFNNIMTIILGHVSHCLSEEPLQSGVRHSLEETRTAGLRAASLTRQLLAFGRKQVMKIVPCCVTDLLDQNREMLERLVGAHVQFHFNIEPHLPAILADPNSFHQILLNLGVNARDAMQGGGTVHITAALASSNRATAEGQAPCVRISFQDNGPGMDELTRAHIFEPFFTTKAVGEGTGLGLSSVHGIMAQHGGWIECESTPEHGAAFHLYFPCAEQTPLVHPPTLPMSRPSGNGWTVLVVEDEPAIRRLLCAILQRFGFTVLEAPDAVAALELWDRPDRPPINSLFTDIVMPGGMSGLQLARVLLERQPDLRIVFSSGYSTDLLNSSNNMDDCGHFLPKPYDLDGVSKILKTVFPPAAA